MHSSRSLLKKISNPQETFADDFVSASPDSEYLPQANHIQQQLDQRNQSRAASYARNISDDNSRRRPSTSAHYPAQSGEELKRIKNNLGQLASTINALSNAQKKPEQARSETDTLALQMHTIARAVSDLQNNFSQFRQESVKPVEIGNLKEAIDRSYRDILDRIDRSANPDIDANAYAQVVEASHADIIEQMKQIQAAIAPGIMSSQNAVQTVENGYHEINQKIGRLEAAISGIGQQQNNGELTDIRLQMEALERSVSMLAEQEASTPVVDFSPVEMRLEEVNRAIVALSSANQATDNLERIEARLIDVSRELDALSSAETSAPHAAVDMEGLENHFHETNKALRDIEARMGDQGQSGFSELDELSAQIVRLADKVDNFSVTAAYDAENDANGPGGTALLGRLDELVDRVEQMQVTADGNASRDEIPLLNSLQEQVQGISQQLDNFSMPEVSLEPISESLGNIEQQLGASRDISIELAAGAAEEALRRIMPDLSSKAGTSNNDMVSALHSDLQKLQQSLGPAIHSDVHFDELKGLLGSIAQRIETVETSLSGERGYQAKTSHEYTDSPASSMPTDYQEVEADNRFLQQETAKEADGDLLVKATRLAHREEAAGESGRHSSASGSQVSSPDNSEVEEREEPELQSVNAPEISPVEIPETNAGFHNRISDSQVAEDDQPLEPGSDMPDLAALVRQANERNKQTVDREPSSGADFLEAARKAARAAALEARVVEAEGGNSKADNSNSLFASLQTMIGKRKKTVLMAAIAALLLAAAVPVVNKFVLNNKPTEIASLEVPEQEHNVTVADSATPVSETVSVVAEPVETETVATNTQPTDDFLEQSVPPSPEQTNSVSASVADNSPDVSKLDFATDALKVAAQQNDPIAIFEIGRRYTNGIGTEKNLEEAAKWYERSANLGYVPAQYLIGNFNEKGIGVEQDRTMAEAWYEQAAENGHVVAMHNLAVMNASPDPVSGNTDLEKALKWFKKAAEHGVRDSQVNAGIFMAKGTGVPVDLIESYKWFAIAAKSGDADAAEKRDFIADAMRPDQLEEARKLVENWKQLEPDQSINVVSIPDSWKSEEDKFALLTDRNSIAQAQLMLDKIGFDVGPADGVMGQRTRDAIANFRAKSGLAVNQNLDNEFMETLKAVSI